MANNGATDGKIMKLEMGLKLGDGQIEMDCDYEEGKALVFVGEMDNGNFNTDKFIKGLDLGFSFGTGKAAYIHTTGVKNPSVDELSKLEIFPKDLNNTVPNQITKIIETPSLQGNNSGRNILYLNFEQAQLHAFGEGLEIPYFRMLYASRPQSKPDNPK